MKIAFLSAAHPPLDKRVFQKEAMALARAGHTVCHICPDDGVSMSVDACRSPVRVLCFHKRPGLLGRMLGLLPLFRYSAQYKADCYHCNEVDSWLVGMLLKVILPCKVVFDVHEHYLSRITEGHLPLVLRSVAKFMLRLMFAVGGRFSDGIVFAKATVAHEFAGVLHKSVIVNNYTPLAVADQARRQSDEECREQVIRIFDMHEGTTIVHLGLFGRERGWPQVLEALALARRRDLALLVVGSFNDGTAPDFVRRADALGLTKRVRIIDWLPFDAAFSLVRGSDIGLVAFQPGIQNHMFASPHKLFDYMLAGIPVVVPACATEVAAIVRSAACGLTVDTSRPEELAGAFDFLASSPERARELGGNGCDAVRSIYNWEAEARKLIDFYQRFEAAGGQLQPHRTRFGAAANKHDVLSRTAGDDP